MSRIRTIRSLLALTILLGGSAVPGAEPNEVTAPLTFEQSPTEIAWPHPGLAPYLRDRIQEGNLIPTSAVMVSLPWLEGLTWPTDLVRKFTENAWQPSALAVSERQRLLLVSMYRDPRGSTQASTFFHPLRQAGYLIERRDPNSYSVLFYAVSQDDAKAMAQAYLRYARGEFDRELENAVRALQGIKDRMAFLEKRIPELEMLGKTSQASLEELRKAVPYRSNAEAAATVAEMDRIVNAVRVEMAGIKAKLDAIHSYGSPKAPAVAARLEEMLVEESIALRAAEARKTEATYLRTQAAKFIELNETITEATNQKNQSAGELRQLPLSLEQQERVVAQLKKREPVALGNKAVLYPVRSDNTPIPAKP
jgi:hypothetical protein